MRKYRNGEVWGFEAAVPPSGWNATAAGGVVLGVDGGTTSTVCVCIAATMPSNTANGDGSPDHPPVLARAVAGCSNHNSVGEVAARETLEQVMAETLLQAGCNRSAVQAVCLAVSGVNHRTDQHRILNWLSKDGREARAAGAGPILGDWGSGYGIASQALTAVVKAYDGRGPQTSLTENILQKLELSSPDELIRWTYADPSWARIAALVPVVVSSAEAGDQVADKILHNSVLELVASVKAVVERLGLCGEDGKSSFPLVMVGGVLEANRRWDIGNEVVKCVLKDYLGAVPIRPKLEPAVGAALLAWNSLAHSNGGGLLFQSGDGGKESLKEGQDILHKALSLFLCYDVSYLRICPVGSSVGVGTMCAGIWQYHCGNAETEGKNGCISIFLWLALFSGEFG